MGAFLCASIGSRRVGLGAATQSGGARYRARACRPCVCLVHRRSSSRGSPSAAITFISVVLTAPVAFPQQHPRTSQISLDYNTHETHSVFYTRLPDATAQYMGCLAHQQSVRKLYWKSKELLTWHTSEA